MPETPRFVGVTHWLTVLFMLRMARSGMEVLAAFPKLYWHDDCPPGRQWARFSRKTYSADSRRMWSGEQEEEAWSPVVALPGRQNLGLGRHWHVATVPFWVLTGGVYVLLVFTSGWWRYMVPTSWGIVPDSIRAIGTYRHFQLPEKLSGQPYEPAHGMNGVPLPVERGAPVRLRAETAPPRPAG
jgi:Prokaryotic cytochrome b561